MRACTSLCTAFFEAYPTAAPATAAGAAPAPAGDNGDFAYLLSNVRSAPQPANAIGQSAFQQQEEM